jgi:hypothetical protein
VLRALAGRISPDQALTDIARIRHGRIVVCTSNLSSIVNRRITQLGGSFDERVRRLGAQGRAQLALVARFGPMTVRAWAAVLRVIIVERLWNVPPRTRPEVVKVGTHS